MHPDKHVLTLNAYSEHLRNMMKEMMNDEFTDVTLICEDKKPIKAHKNILSACSPIFKDIVKLEQSDKPINLRGINFSELESIMQYIYLGEATFYEKRMNEFLEVARSLEIKELCHAETDTSDDEPLPSDHMTSTDISEEQTLSHSLKQAPKNIEDWKEVVKLKGRFQCDLCDNSFNSSSPTIITENQLMMVQSILVINVTIRLNIEVILKIMLRHYMKV